MAISQPDWSPYKVLNDNPLLMVDPNGAKEFESYDAYKKEMGDKALSESEWKGQDGHWLTSDRTGKSNRWDNANWYNIENKAKGQYTEFDQITSFYEWVYNESRVQGHEVNWMKGAHLLETDLIKMQVLETTSGVVPDELYNIMNDLAIGIADFAVEKFNELLIENSQTPIKGDKAFYWDWNFIRKEQGEVAPPIYRKYTTGTDDQQFAVFLMNVIAQKKAEPYMTSMPPVLKQLMASQVPAFPGLVTDTQLRIQMPMMMLYPDRFKPTHPGLKKMDINQFKNIKFHLK
jgi:hypothetical protein